MKADAIFFGILALLLALANCPAWAQSAIRRYVRQHAQPVASIEPGNRNYTDLEAFGRAVGEARVVMLGEQDHGDGATMLAKSRLVQYLHERKGFTVLAFEGDFLALNLGWQQTPIDSASQVAFLRGNIYPVWSRCQQCSVLLVHYIPQTYRRAQPLRVAGFDNQLYGNWSKRHLGSYLHVYLAKARVPFLTSASYERFFRPFLDTLLNPVHFVTGSKDLAYSTAGGRRLAINHKHEKLARFTAYLDTIQAQLQAAPAADFERLLLRNLYALAEESAAYTEDTNATYNARDTQMAANLDWLVNTKYAGQKIIVWAASFHVAKGQEQDYQQPAHALATPQARPEAIRTMGRQFVEDPRNRRQTYVLGFASGAGSSKRVFAPAPALLAPPHRNTLESWFPPQLAYAFLDFQPYRQQQAPAEAEFFYMNGLGHTSSLARWTNFFDGVFYLRTMAPCLETTAVP